MTNQGQTRTAASEIMPTMKASAVSLGSGDDAAGGGEEKGEKRKGEIKAPRESLLEYGGRFHGYS
jgi:hypothetical protein